MSSPAVRTCGRLRRVTNLRAAALPDDEFPLHRCATSLPPGLCLGLSAHAPPAPSG